MKIKFYTDIYTFIIEPDIFREEVIWTINKK